MSAWHRDILDEEPLSEALEADDDCHDDGLGYFAHLREHGEDEARLRSAAVTPTGAAWLASATTHPRSTLALWETRPSAPGVVPCGTVFDVVNAPAVFGRRMLDRLWEQGPGCGPVATHRGRMLLFATPGTAHRLPALLDWVRHPPTRPAGASGSGIPRLLCHGSGDAVTVPSLAVHESSSSRWLVAPDTRHPWLPGPDVLLWAAMQAVRETPEDNRFSLPRIRVLRSTTSAGAASSVG